MRDINNFYKISINVASPDRILEWSYGEVKKPETINYRTLKPERDGLFCEKIFGTTKEWECYCGKFKGIRYKGVICDRCGVEVAHFKVRRERMGHIQLACPVSHIWYYKSVPSRISLLLGISVNELRSILYFEKYVVIEPGDSDLNVGQLVNDSEYQNFKKQYGINFTAEIGAIAIKKLLDKFDIDKIEAELREKMNEKRGKTDLRLLRRLEVIVDFKQSNNSASHMIMDIIPVIPPELRPMVQLDGGRFATSDLNDLYRRVINRNNRLKRLLALKAPEIIIRNEKRMLQEAVDALFDNSRRKRILKGVGNRPLKSLSDMLKGKQGRFRQNLLGKRVDYSGRSVIVVGPKLKLHQCGIPKKMALELFKPFIMHGLVEQDLVYNIKSAKQMVEEEKPEVWGILEKVINKHPILLNRAPTLHRLGIQAFEPVLVEGKAIQLHPLVCHAFNADFDGDQMAIHLPLSIEAQIECWFLMLSVHNLLNPANGEAIIGPTQDMVLGINYLTKEKSNENGQGKYFSSVNEVLFAIESKEIKHQAKIFVCDIKGNKNFIETTAGRIIFNNALPENMEYINKTLNDKMLGEIIVRIIKEFGPYETTVVLDKIKDIGFKYSTFFGSTIGMDDICIPKKKKDLIKNGDLKVKKIEENYRNGYLTEDERYNQVIDVWTRINDSISDTMMNDLKINQNGFNPIYVMADSGAKGSKQQIRQLAGMRGLMAKPSGEILEFPIKSNFKEGLSVLEYFISTHGARKGLADTALKTADAGYLTRRLVDISQDVVIGEIDCNTIKGVEVSGISTSNDIKDETIQKIIGRFSSEDIMHPQSNQIIVKKDGEITEKIAEIIQKSGLDKIKVRTVSTCESRKSVCAKCYGYNLATGKQVGLGEAVGIIAAQSIGQPGTQLTMRTFHIGGTAARQIEEQNIIFPYSTIIKQLPENLIKIKDCYIINNKSELILQKVIKEYNYNNFKEVKVKDLQKILIGDVIGIDKNEKEIKSEHNCIINIYSEGEEKLILLITDNQRVGLKSGTKLFINKEKKYIAKNKVIAEFDPYNELILSEYEGNIKYQDIIIGSTLKIEKEQDSNFGERIITEVRDGSLTPRIIVLDEDGEELSSITIPGGSYLLVEEGDKVYPGDPIAKITSAQTKTRDITGGLPRISELFEARKPKDSCIISEQDGIIRFVGKQKGKVIFNVESEAIDPITGENQTINTKHVIPSNKRLLIRDGDYVKAGDQLCDGPVNLHDMLKIEGVPKLQEYLVNEIQEVYKLQGVSIHEKHIEIIIRQMLRKVEITDAGDTDLIIGQQIDNVIFHDKNDLVIEEGGKPATAQPILQGITKAALNIESFISSASFQETTKVLTNAAIKGSIDNLKGLKENVIIGHLIPAGTGIRE